jgi:hypothetical protein
MTLASDLARRTRPRFGTNVKVTSALLWLHSSVTDTMAMTGSRMVVGIPTAAMNEL